MSVLVAKDLTKTFLHPAKCELLKGASLTVDLGETVAIMGPSGVGKSTLLHILGTLDTPDSGSLEISNHNAIGEKGAFLRNQHIGFVFQNYNLLEEYSVLENILMPSRIGREWGHEERAKKLLKEVGLENHTHHLAKQLSGGEKQRAAIARALCNNPNLILADEPSGNLDEENSAKIHDILISTAKNLNKGLIVVTHNRELAKECDVVYTLHGGRLERL
ncbi:MAG: ABC transporter ATP-binding protein [Chlamydiia bacterium]|nr:ABC transporter ATP-binding protein [Chlamydiia bacterium]